MFPIIAVIVAALTWLGTSWYYKHKKLVRVIVHYNDGKPSQIFLAPASSTEEIRQGLHAVGGAPANVARVELQKQVMDRGKVAGVDTAMCGWRDDVAIYIKY